MTKKTKGFVLTFIYLYLCWVLADILRGTAISGIIMVVGGLFLITLLIISSVEYLGEKEWGSAAVNAAVAGIAAWAVWRKFLDCPWHQLPEEIDKVVNILMEFFK